MNLPRTYADIPNRMSSLASPEAQALLGSFPTHIRELVVDRFLASPSPIPQELFNYFTANSAIFRLNHQVPGSSLVFEYLYTREVSSSIDQYFIDCKAGFQIYQRLQSLEANLPYWLNCLLNNRDALLVDNVGSGTGRDMIGVLAKNPQLAKKVRVRHIDTDIESLGISKMLAGDRNVADSFSFCWRQIRRYATRRSGYGSSHRHSLSPPSSCQQSRVAKSNSVCSGKGDRGLQHGPAYYGHRRSIDRLPYAAQRVAYDLQIRKRERRPSRVFGVASHRQVLR